MKLVKIVELKAFTIGIGLSVAFLAMSFLASLDSQSTDKNHDPVPKNIPVSQQEEHYTEVRGMN